MKGPIGVINICDTQCSRSYIVAEVRVGPGGSGVWGRCENFFVLPQERDFFPKHRAPRVLDFSFLPFLAPWILAHVIGTAAL